MIYQNIKAVADSKKIPISQIEKDCEITPRYICTWDRRNPQVDTIAKVAKYLGVTIESLLKD